MKKILGEDSAPISDVITLVANDQHAEATSIVNDLLSARVLDSLQAHKETIAHSLFAPSADALSEETLEEKNWIAGAIKNKGGLHRALHVPQGEKIPAKKLEAASHKGGKVGKEANLAKTLKGFHKEEVVREEHESVEDFVKRGGKVKHIPAAAAHGAEEPQIPHAHKKASAYYIKKR